MFVGNKLRWIILCLYYHVKAETIEILLAISGNFCHFLSEIDDKVKKIKIRSSD